MKTTSDPFSFTEDEKVIILLARIFYLKACIYKKERPHPDPLHTGQSVLRTNALTAVDLLGYDEGSVSRLTAEANDLLATAQRVYEDNKTAA